MKKPSFIICGLEHSGTTLVSDIFRQIPACESGFEVGIQLFHTPREYFNEMNNPWRDTILGGWGIDYATLKSICDTDSTNDFYDGLITSSSFINETHNIFFDKTPRYLMRIRSVINKTEIPIIVLYKDPRAIIFSGWKRRMNQKLTFLEWLKTNGIRPYIKKCYERIAKQRTSPTSPCAIASLEQICAKPSEIMGRLFSHVGLEFKEEYLTIKSSRYAHTKGTQVNADLTTEYKNVLTSEEQEAMEKQLKILELTEFFAEHQ